MAPTIEPLLSEEFPEAAIRLLDGLAETLPSRPALFLTAARSTATLGALHSLIQAAKRTALPEALRHAISLRVSQLNGSRYCLAAHGESARRAGADEASVLDSRRGFASDPKWQALLSLATKIVEDRGHHARLAVDLARGSGATDGEVIDVVQLVALGIFTDYLSNVAGTELDAPSVDLALPAERRDRRQGKKRDGLSPPRRAT